MHLRLKNGGLTEREMRVMKTYLFYLHIALIFYNSFSFAALGNYILVEVTARAFKGLSIQEIHMVS